MLNQLSHPGAPKLFVCFLLFCFFNRKRERERAQKNKKKDTDTWRGGGNVTSEVEFRVMQPGEATEGLESPGSGRGKEGSSGGAFRKSTALLTV